ncbi:MAG: InlB B-repeat-containing protein [Anaerobutyricum soehngenii]
MDFLAAGDAVDVFLKGKVRLDVGNLFELKNIVELTARYKRATKKHTKSTKKRWKKRKEDGNYSMDANNGSGEIETDSETPCREGNKITVNGNAFLYEGHYFTEWNTNPDGSGERWNPDTVYNMPGNDVKLYAQWKKNPDEKEEEASQDHNNQRKYPGYNLIYHSNNKKKNR